MAGIADVVGDLLRRRRRSGRPGRAQRRADHEQERMAAAVRLWSDRAPQPLARVVRVADLGCHDGRLRDHLVDVAPLPVRYTGVDLRELAKGLPRLDVDVVFALGVMDRVADASAFLRAMHDLTAVAVISYPGARQQPAGPGRLTAPGLLDLVHCATGLGYRVLETREVNGDVIALCTSDPLRR